jgi:hypothetical protein
VPVTVSLTERRRSRAGHPVFALGHIASLPGRGVHERLRRGWIGQCQNQYGSTLTITDDADQQLQRTFRTALGDSGFAGEEIEIIGLNCGDYIHFAFSRSGPAGDTVASFTGLLRDSRMETLWHVIADSAVKSPQPGQPPELIKLPWAHAAQTNADTFVHING